MSIQRLGRGLLIGLVVAGAALFLLLSDGVERLDHVAYDQMTGLHARAVDPRIAIIAVDEKSLRELGRWPWSRRTHARLVDRLTEAGAAAVGFDVLFSEADTGDPDGDRLFAEAIERNGRVALVVGPEEQAGGAPISEVLPLPELAFAANELAHIDFELDADGIGRSVYLHAGLGTPHWQVFGRALLAIAEPDHPSLARTELDGDPSTGERPGWVRSNPLLIPYAGPPGHITQLSYVDVLEGRIPDEQLRERILMIGATAVGLGDVLSTPVSQGHRLMAGIEVNANVLAALLDGHLLASANLPTRIRIDLLLVTGLLLWLVFLPTRAALPGLLLAVTTTLLLSAYLTARHQLWFPPATALLVQLSTYLAWSWFDLTAVSRLAGQLGIQLHREARHDRLTGLPNRSNLEEHLDQRLPELARDNMSLGLMVVSMGQHRSVLDMAGVRGSDRLVEALATRIQQLVPNPEAVYRIEGTVFAVLVDPVTDPHQLEGLSVRLVQSLQMPFEIDNESYTLVPNIGAARFPSDGDATGPLLDNATTAMHRIRRDRHRSFTFYTQSLHEEVKKRSHVEQALKQALNKGEFYCLYQPQVAVSDRRLVGVETLIRWHNPELGEISPAEFVPLAEQSGQIVPIGAWILEQACRQGALWLEEHGFDIRIAVNLSATQFDSPGLVEAVTRALERSGLPPARLELELTETALLEDFDAAKETLLRLKMLGVELAIDDFGTGYSSLTYLQRFPMDRVKIDQSFIRDVATSAATAEISRSVIAMAHRLQLQVIAEGIEEEAQMQFLESEACDEAQGYLFGKAMSAEALEAEIASGRLTTG